MSETKNVFLNPVEREMKPIVYYYSKNVFLTYFYFFFLSEIDTLSTKTIKNTLRNIFQLLISRIICKNLNIIFFFNVCVGGLYINFRNIMLICIIH